MADADLQERIFRFLSGKPKKSESAAKLVNVLRIPKKSINAQLYMMEREGRIVKHRDTPPTWGLPNQQNSRDTVQHNIHTKRRSVKNTHEQQCTATEEEKIVDCLRNAKKPMRPIEIAKGTGHSKAMDVNKRLYSMQKKGIIVKKTEKPPTWELCDTHLMGACGSTDHPSTDDVYLDLEPGGDVCSEDNQQSLDVSNFQDTDLFSSHTDTDNFSFSDDTNTDNSFKAGVDESNFDQSLSEVAEVLSPSGGLAESIKSEFSEENSQTFSTVHGVNDLESCPSSSIADYVGNVKSEDSENFGLEYSGLGEDSVNSVTGNTSNGPSDFSDETKPRKSFRDFFHLDDANSRSSVDSMGSAEVAVKVENISCHVTDDNLEPMDNSSTPDEQFVKDSDVNRSVETQERGFWAINSDMAASSPQIPELTSEQLTPECKQEELNFDTPELVATFLDMEENLPTINMLIDGKHDSHMTDTMEEKADGSKDHMTDITKANDVEETEAESVEDIANDKAEFADMENCNKVLKILFEMKFAAQFILKKKTGFSDDELNGFINKCVSLNFVTGSTKLWKITPSGLEYAQKKLQEPSTRTQSAPDVTMPAQKVKQTFKGPPPPPMSLLNKNKTSDNINRAPNALTDRSNSGFKTGLSDYNSRMSSMNNSQSLFEMSASGNEEVTKQTIPNVSKSSASVPRNSSGPPSLMSLQFDHGQFGNTSSSEVGQFGNTSSSEVGQFGKTSSNQVGQFGNTSSNQVGQFGNTSSNQVGQFVNTSSNQVGQFGNTSSNQVGQFGNTSSNQVGQFGYTSSNQVGQFGNTSSNQVGQFGNTSSNQVGQFGYTSSNQVGQFGNTSCSQSLFADSDYQSMPSNRSRSDNKAPCSDTHSGSYSALGSNKIPSFPKVAETNQSTGSPFANSTTLKASSNVQSQKYSPYTQGNKRSTPAVPETTKTKIPEKYANYPNLGPSPLTLSQSRSKSNERSGSRGTSSSAFSKGPPPSPMDILQVSKNLKKTEISPPNSLKDRTSVTSQSGSFLTLTQTSSTSNFGTSSLNSDLMSRLNFPRQAASTGSQNLSSVAIAKQSVTVNQSSLTQSSALYMSHGKPSGYQSLPTSGASLSSSQGTGQFNLNTENTQPRRGPPPPPAVKLGLQSKQPMSLPTTVQKPVKPTGTANLGLALSSESFAALNKNPVSALMEYAQSRKMQAQVEVVSQRGSSHKPTFEMAAFVGKRRFPSITCHNKKDGRKEACDIALRQLIAEGQFQAEQDAASGSNSSLTAVPSANMTHFDTIAALTHRGFTALVSQITAESFAGRKVIAGLVMKRAPDDTGVLISLGTGNRCITGQQLSLQGNTVNDSHAEIITRRGFLRFLYKQLLEYDPNRSNPMFEKSSSGKLQIRSNITFHLYISTAPCGDGALFSPRDAETSKTPVDTRIRPPHEPTFSNNVQGVLRTKVEGGEGTIPIEAGFKGQTFDGIQRGERLRTMSCTDKICRWNVVGMQGALLTHFLEPVYLDSLTLGLLYDHGHLARAVCCRIGRGNTDINTQLPSSYKLNHPWLGRVTVCDPPREVQKTKALSINWSFGDRAPEVTDGTQGLCYTSIEKGFFSRCSKRSLFTQFRCLCEKFGRQDLLQVSSYNDAKIAATDFVSAKGAMLQRFKENGYGKWVSKPVEEEMFGYEET